MATGPLNPLQILETAEMNVTHENHDTALVVMVCTGDLLQLRRLVSIPHCYDASARRNQRPDEIHDRVEPRNDFRRADELRPSLRHVIETTRTGANAYDHGVLLPLIPHPSVGDCSLATGRLS